MRTAGGSSTATPTSGASPGAPDDDIAKLRDLDQNGGAAARTVRGAAAGDGSRRAAEFWGLLVRNTREVGGGLIAGLLGLLLVVRRRGRVAAANVVRIGAGHLTLTNAQHIGARPEQQDAFGFSDPADAALLGRVGVVGVVADGMGGLALGAQASNGAVRAFLQSVAQLAQGETPVPDVLVRALEEANRAVVELARRAGMQEGVGTTLAAVAVGPEGIHWASAGDTRIYLVRDGRLHQLNVDHNYGRMLARDVARGKLSREEAATRADRQALTSYLGLPEVHEVDHNPRPYPLLPGDQVVICTDGVYGTVSEDEMARVIGVTPHRVSENLVARTRASNRPGQDNITVVTLSYAESAFSAVRRSAARRPAGDAHTVGA